MATRLPAFIKNCRVKKFNYLSRTLSPDEFRRGGEAFQARLEIAVSKVLRLHPTSPRSYFKVTFQVNFVTFSTFKVTTSGNQSTLTLPFVHPTVTST